MGKIADKISGRVAGAVKQHDQHGVLGENVVDEVAAEMAEVFEEHITGRMSKESAEVLAGEREPEPEEDNGDE